MEKKYIKFYKTFHKKFKNDENLILCSNTLCDGGVEPNGALKRKDYGSIWNAGNVVGKNGVCIWTNSIFSNTKTHKVLKRKSKSRREPQRRVMHQTSVLNHRRLVLTRLINIGKKCRHM